MKQAHAQTSPPRRRGRPRPEDTAAIGLHILSVAKKLFLREGYSGLIMEAVAAEADVSKPTLYARYPDKAHLFRAVVADRLDAWKGESVLESAPSKPRLQDGLVRFATIVLDLVFETEIGPFSLMVAAEAPRFPEVAETFWDLSIQHALSLLKRHITGAVDVVVSDRQAEAIACRLYEMLWGWHSFQVMRGGKPNAEERAAGACQCVQLLLHGALSPCG